MVNQSVGNTCHMKSGSKKIREGRKVVKTSISCLDSFNQDKTHTHDRVPPQIVSEKATVFLLYLFQYDVFFLTVCLLGSLRKQYRVKWIEL